GFRRNDEKWCFSTFYEFIILYLKIKLSCRKQPAGKTALKKQAKDFIDGYRRKFIPSGTFVGLGRTGLKPLVELAA
ncbi:MAG: hypothetical protein QME06_07150, partial [Desulfobacterales bacterium]|nr:hypothetical protein [Desulfobacterales bacterium]